MKLALFFLFLGLGVLPAFSQVPTSIQGTVQKLLMDQLLILPAGGEPIIVFLSPDSFLNRKVLASVKDFKKGDWVGVDSKPDGNGNQVAVAINIFNQEMVVKIRKGQFPMATGDLMTNAPVVSVDAGETESLSLKSENSMVEIRLTPETVIHKLLPLKLSGLTPGTKVTVRGTIQADGRFLCANLTAE